MNNRLLLLATASLMTVMVACNETKEEPLLKPRVIILTDIGRPDLEPDDTESLVHLLCYADMLEIEGNVMNLMKRSGQGK